MTTTELTPEAPEHVLSEIDLYLLARPLADALGHGLPASHPFVEPAQDLPSHAHNNSPNRGPPNGSQRGHRRLRPRTRRSGAPAFPRLHQDRPVKTYVCGASETGTPHLVPLSRWPTSYNRPVLARCGRPTIKEVPEPSPDQLCGNCRRLRGTDNRPQPPAPGRDNYLEPIRRAIVDEILRRRHRLSNSADTANLKTQRAAIITGLVIALAITVGVPGDQHAADLYIQQRATT